MVGKNSIFPRKILKPSYIIQIAVRLNSKNFGRLFVNEKLKWLNIRNLKWKLITIEIEIRSQREQCRKIKSNIKRLSIRDIRIFSNQAYEPWYFEYKQFRKSSLWMNKAYSFYQKFLIFLFIFLIEYQRVW